MPSYTNLYEYTSRIRNAARMEEKSGRPEKALAKYKLAESIIDDYCEMHSGGSTFHSAGQVMRIRERIIDGINKIQSM